MASSLAICTLLQTGISSAREVSLSWHANREPDVIGYRVYYGEKPNTYTKVLTTDRPTATLKNLDPGLSYFCAVSAFNREFVQSPLSSEIEIPPTKGNKTTIKDPVLEGKLALARTNSVFKYLLESIHGPSVDSSHPATEIYNMAGKSYLAVRYTADPKLFQYLRIDVERSTSRQLSWKASESVFVTAWPSRDHPGLLEFLYRSPAPVGTSSREFFRLRYRSLFNAKDLDRLSALERAAQNFSSKTRTSSKKTATSTHLSK